MLKSSKPSIWSMEDLGVNNVHLFSNGHIEGNGLTKRLAADTLFSFPAWDCLSKYANIFAIIT